MVFEKYSSIDLKLISLNRKKMDFYNFCLINFDEIGSMSIKNLASKFGCGMSFIYSFFKDLKIKSFKEFLSYLNYKIGKNENIEQVWNNYDEIPNIIFQSAKQNKLLIIDQFEMINKLVDSIFNKNTKTVFGGTNYSYLSAYDMYELSDVLTNLKWEVLKIDKNHPNVFSKSYEEFGKKITFVFYSLSGRNKMINKIINKLLENGENDVFLITANKHHLNKNLKNVIYVNNIMKDVDAFTKEIIFSSSYNFIILNTFLKSIAFKKHKSLFLENMEFIDEFNWWETPFKIKGSY